MSRFRGGDNPAIADNSTAGLETVRPPPEWEDGRRDAYFCAVTAPPALAATAVLQALTLPALITRPRLE